MVISHMAKHIVKMDTSSSSFRIVIPRKLIQILAWENIEYVVIEEFPPHGIKIRNWLDEKKTE